MAVGEFVKEKFTLLFDEVEVVGTVRVIDPATDGSGGHDDSLGIEPDPGYNHLIRYSRGNNPLPWWPDGSPGLLHCESYPLTTADIDRWDPWALPKKPDNAPFMVKLPGGSERVLQVGDHVRLTGRWVVDHHPEFCAMQGRCRNRGLLRVGQTHIEFHPFRWDDIRLVEPTPPYGTAAIEIALAAPIHEEQYVGDWHWTGNELAGVAGKLFLDEGGDAQCPFVNFHNAVDAWAELAAPPAPTDRGPSALPVSLVWSERLLKLGVGMQLATTRTISLADPTKLLVHASIVAPAVNGQVPTVHSPAIDQLQFKARYEAQWLESQRDWRYCERCAGLFFGPGRDASVCPAGAVHTVPATGSGDYSLLHNAPGAPDRQSNWRWCSKCQGLFFGGGIATSVCPAGGQHADPALSGSGDYSLLHGTSIPFGRQDDWRWCNKCQGLRYGPATSNSRCPAGGGHATQQQSKSGNYSLLHA